MGKSDPYINEAYKKVIQQKKWKSIGFFGFPESSPLTDWFDSPIKDFYDLKNKNWNINIYPYKVDRKYDLIVCTRVAYFCKDPEKLINSFKELLSDEGKILIDWGLGDHWRFDNYKIGWVKDEEHEWAYEKNNYLWSTVWSDNFQKHINFRLFQEWIKKKGYSDLKSAVFKEVPKVLNLDNTNLQISKNILCDIVTLWEDSPQMYIILVLTK